jgi:hypothetical protein
VLLFDGSGVLKSGGFFDFELLIFLFEILESFLSDGKGTVWTSNF